jgi:hypothetical protein
MHSDFAPVTLTVSSSTPTKRQSASSTAMAQPSLNSRRKVWPPCWSLTAPASRFHSHGRVERRSRSHQTVWCFGSRPRVAPSNRRAATNQIFRAPWFGTRRVQTIELRLARERPRNTDSRQQVVDATKSPATDRIMNIGGTPIAQIARTRPSALNKRRDGNRLRQFDDACSPQHKIVVILGRCDLHRARQPVVAQSDRY